MDNVVLFSITLLVIYLLIWFDGESKEKKLKQSSKHVKKEVEYNLTNNDLNNNLSNKTNETCELENMNLTNVEFNSSTEQCRNDKLEQQNKSLKEEVIFQIEKDKKLAKKKQAKSRALNLVLNLPFNLLQILCRSIIFSVKFVFLLAKIAIRLLFLIASIKNSFLSKLILFYLIF